MSAWFVCSRRRRDAVDRERRKPARDAGDDAEGNARLCEGQSLLAATPEDERIAALEAQDALPLASKCHQALADVALKRRRLAAALSCVFEADALARQGKNSGVDEGVIDDDIRRREPIEGMNRQEPRVARPGAHEPHRTRGEARAEASDGGRGAHATFIAFAHGTSLPARVRNRRS